MAAGMHGAGIHGTEVFPHRLAVRRLALRHVVGVDVEPERNHRPRPPRFDDGAGAGKRPHFFQNTGICPLFFGTLPGSLDFLFRRIGPEVAAVYDLMAVFDRDPGPFQSLDDLRRRPEFLPARLRMCMEIPPPCSHFFLIMVEPLQIHFNSHRSQPPHKI